MDFTWLMNFFLSFLPKLAQDIVNAAVKLYLGRQMMSVGQKVLSDPAFSYEGDKVFEYRVEVTRTK